MSRKVINVLLGVFASLAFALAGCGGGGGTPAASLTSDSAVAKYAGTYTGTFSGSDSGTFEMTVSSSGVITGSGYNNITKKTGTGSGAIGSNGAMNMVIGTTSTGASFTGAVDATGKMQGNWTDGSATGTFTGQRNEGAIVTPATTPTENPVVTPTSSLKGNWSGTANYSTWYYNDCILTIDENNNVSGTITYYRNAPAAFSYYGTCSVSGTLASTTGDYFYHGYLKSSSCTGDNKAGFDMWVSSVNSANNSLGVSFAYESGGVSDLSQSYVIISGTLDKM